MRYSARLRKLLRTLLDVVVSKGSAILQLLTSEDQALLIGGDSCKATFRHSHNASLRQHEQKNQHLS